MDSTILQFLAAPFVASLILTGIHAYLGVHVVERGVIFVDLSLAQIAALGATIAILLPITGGDPHAPVVYWISLAFTFIGALVFSTIRSQRARIPQEAIIGICYAVASAAAILAMSKATSESEHLKDMLVGNILAVSWPEVGKTAAALRRDRRRSTTSSGSKFLAISMDHESGRGATGISIRFWDFLFYASFGFVVTSSVAIAGVLLVFCYLIVPSVAAMLYADTIGKRLAIGWTMGTIVSALGVYLSLLLDLPTGATIVCTFGLVLILMARPVTAPLDLSAIGLHDVVTAEPKSPTRRSSAIVRHARRPRRNIKPPRAARDRASRVDPAIARCRIARRSVRRRCWCLLAWSSCYDSPAPMTTAPRSLDVHSAVTPRFATTGRSPRSRRSTRRRCPIWSSARRRCTARITAPTKCRAACCSASRPAAVRKTARTVRSRRTTRPASTRDGSRRRSTS